MGITGNLFKRARRLVAYSAAGHDVHHERTAIQYGNGSFAGQKLRNAAPVQIRSVVVELPMLRRRI
jgi:hypothetical protein